MASNVCALCPVHPDVLKDSQYNFYNMFRIFYQIALVLIIGLLLSGCSVNTGKRVYPGMEWKESSPESQDMDPAKLSEAIDFLNSKLASTGGIQTLVIIRNGYLVHKGSEAYKVHCIWSGTKSFTSTVLGLLVGEGRCSLNTKAMDITDLMKEKYPGITLRHFATMTSGYDAAGGRYGEEDPDDGSKTPLVPADPAFAPGTEYSYFDDAMRMNGYLLTLIAGMDLESYFERKIAIPVGMDTANFKWDFYPENDKVYTWSNPQGADVRDGAGGLYITPLDLARFGYLFLNHGNWNGHQLLSAEWVREATACQVPADMAWRNDTPRQRQLGQRGVGRYGYNWWLNATGEDGKLLYPDAPADLYLASGYNNNKCFVIPAWDMVIVRTGNEGTPDDADFIWDQFLKMVGNSLKDTPANL